MTMHVRARLLALAVVMVLVVGVVACGDSSDDGGGDSGSSAAQSADGGGDASSADLATTQAGSDEDQIAATMHYMRRVYNAGNVKAFCDKLTASGKRQVAAFGGRIRSGKTCEDVLTTVSKNATGDGQHPVKVFSVKVDGDQGVVRFKGGVVGSAVVPMRVRKENGEWKLTEVHPARNAGVSP